MLITAVCRTESFTEKKLKAGKQEDVVILGSVVGMHTRAPTVGWERSTVLRNRGKGGEELGALLAYRLICCAKQSCRVQ